MTASKITLIDSDSTEHTYRNLLTFNFKKNIFQPYTTLSTMFETDVVIDYDIKSVKLYLNNILVHEGFCDILKSYKKNGCIFTSITSRGFTAEMMQNYLAPGLYTNISFNTLMENYITLPHVTHEDDSTGSNYIYVAENKSFWDSVCSLGYKLKGNLPYITGTNMVNISLPSGDSYLRISDGVVIEIGRKSDYRNLLSDIYMEDIDGTYDTYHLHCDEASDLDISRRKEIALDKQFLYSPMSALSYRIMQTLEKKKLKYIKCNGFYFADLYYKLQYDEEFSGKSIVSIEVAGNSDGVFTSYYVQS